MDNRCIQGLESLPASLRGCVLTIGNFDGVHLGHQRIIRTGGELARREGTSMVAMTFEPPPDQVLRPKDVVKRITPPEQKVQLLLAAGCDAVVLVTADRDFLSMQPQDFIDRVLVGRFAPRHVVEGPNFFFGLRRSGSVETLRQAAAAGGFQMHVVEPVTLELSSGVERVSSTLVRSLVEGGLVEDAQRCLGRDFSLYGTVARGTERGGKLLGFPTANLSCPQQVIPGDGVYAGWARADGASSVAAISIGLNPTLGGVAQRTVEAHLLDWGGAELYGQPLVLTFVQRLRDQEKFSSVEALRAQIAEDIARVRQIVK